jgi:NodT family efflux transporter outer membrane factor (OMF) lipoprotein
MTMRRTAGFVAPLAALALAGCSLVPDFVQPGTPAPDRWINAPATAQPANWPSADWWRGFDSKPLDGLIATAEANNTDIAAAAARVLQADAQARIAGAPLLPSLEGNAGASRSWARSNGSVSSSGFARPPGAIITTDLDANLSASYQLDLFGANRASLAAAEASALFSRFDRQTVALTILSSVADTYFQTVQFRDRLRVANRNLQNALDVLQIVQARVNAGAASALDLAQQQTVVAQQRAAIPPLEARERESSNALAILLGAAPAATVIDGSTIMNITPPAVTPGLPSTLLARRPDIQSAEAQLVAANAQIGVARAAFFPNIALTAQAGYASASLGSLFHPASAISAVAASLIQPIFEGGKLEGGLDLAKGRYIELVADYRKAVISAFADVENALVAVQRTAEQETLQQQAVQQARLAYSLAEARYRAGAVDLLTVLQVQQTLFSAEDQLVQVHFARLQAAVAMFKALGGGWQASDITRAIPSDYARP